MEIKILKPRKAINKAFLKIKPNRTEIESFKTNLIELLDRKNDTESEEFHKNLVSDFLKDTYYKNNHFINTKGRNDLVIHNGNKAKSTVGVIIVAKKPTNKTEMLTKERINVKAFQELVLYYLRERITHKNLEIKYLVVTNINEWYIFDSNVFEKQFAQNKGLVKQFNDFENGRLAGKTTDFFYKEIAEPFVNALKQEIEFTFFDIREYEKPLRNDNPKDDNKLISLFKLLSPEHLLKLPFANDSNSLDKRFYGELLHIIGLIETKEKSKKLIERKNKGERNTGSFLENAIIQLDSLDKINRLDNPSHFGITQEERLFNVGLELSITWINRILFLKLLEAQLKTYHKGDKSYEFLSIDKIQNYDDLNSLFFQVLARQQSERNEDVTELFAKVPYLNSSLFEPTGIEHGTLFISNLRDDKTIPIYSSTVLKTESGKKRTGNLSTLEYLFEFLNAYDFSSEGKEEIQEDNKTLINASVLGLIFEKINGYKDGSFFTPGFITMYMCRETIRKSVVQKFNETKDWNCKDIDSLYDKIEDRQEANNIINSLKICDPAVGSGHFLVSALNEMIAIKNDLKILQDRDGKRLKEYVFEVVNDELIVTDEDGELFEYSPTNKESQRIQETLFHEKQTIIENCLFGVDINPNSVKICRLRLWIELLKNAYYKNESELETLPNIDINIKCGNSLISRFELDADLKKALKSSKWTIDSYRIAVDTYRNAQNKEQKRAMEKLIDEIKNDFRSEISLNDPKVKKLKKLQGEIFGMTNQTQMFELTKREKSAWNKKLKQLAEDSKKLEIIIEEIKNNKIFEEAFEWRFEFPEVLDDNGDFVGFDSIIGNPPYIQIQTGSDISEKNYYQNKYISYHSSADIYCLFYEIGLSILKTKGNLGFITSNKFIRSDYGKNLRKLFIEYDILSLIDFGELPVFDSASTFPLITLISKTNKIFEEFYYHKISTLNFQNFEEELNAKKFVVSNESLGEGDWQIVDKKTKKLLEKIVSDSIPLSVYTDDEIYFGLKTGRNVAYIIDENQKNAFFKESSKYSDVIKPVATGDDMRRYYMKQKQKYVILAKIGLDLKQYPLIEEHLLKFKSQLESRSDKGKEWWQLRSCDYYDKLNDTKIHIPAFAKEPRFTYDTEGFVPLGPAYFISTSDKYLAGIMNSKIFWYYLKKITPVLGDDEKSGRLVIRTTYLKNSPIKVASVEYQKTISNLVDEILEIKSKNPNQNTGELESRIDKLVFQIYNLTEDEIKIIENANA
jgi:hypothetical protein